MRKKIKTDKGLERLKRRRASKLKEQGGHTLKEQVGLEVENLDPIEL